MIICPIIIFFKSQSVNFFFMKKWMENGKRFFKPKYYRRIVFLKIYHIAICSIRSVFQIPYVFTDINLFKDLDGFSNEKISDENILGRPTVARVSISKSNLNNIKMKMAVLWASLYIYPIRIISNRYK